MDRLKASYDNNQDGGVWIPCQYLPATSTLGENHVIIYLHGNSCDLGDMCEEMQEINLLTGRHVIQMEYPGYGICQDLVTKPEVIDYWARALVKFLLICGVDLWQIYIMGRSIGTGPAASLARWVIENWLSRTLPGSDANRVASPRDGVTTGPLGGLILHSPYLSIHKIVSDYVWNMVTFIIPNYWDTEENVAFLEKFNVPLLVIHGKEDEVIPVAHGKQLLDNYKGVSKVGSFSLTSHHNSYDVPNDVCLPIRQLISLSAKVPYTERRNTRQLIPLWAHNFQPVSEAAYRVSADKLNPLTRLLFCGCGGTPPFGPAESHHHPGDALICQTNVSDEQGDQ